MAKKTTETEETKTEGCLTYLPVLFNNTTIGNASYSRVAAIQVPPIWEKVMKYY